MAITEHFALRVSSFVAAFFALRTSLSLSLKLASSSPSFSLSPLSQAR